jgi:peptidoglycan pentaglycine glycine transferase (the first glycine)
VNLVSVAGEHSGLTGDPVAWDAAVSAAGGNLLQSWRWGAFKQHFGWEVERVAVERGAGLALAQVLFRRRAGLSIGYIPRGPVVTAGDEESLRLLWQEIDAVARRRRAITTIVEPDGVLPPAPVRGVTVASRAGHIQPGRTVKVPLTTDDELLGQMHQKTRYNVRLAQRRGVTCRVSDMSDEALRLFYELLEDTSVRNAFGIHSADYYREFHRQFGDDAVLLFAEHEGRAVAGVVAVAFGDEAIYMYGASSTKDRAHGAGFLVQFEAMRWARERGCRRYDLWGIPVLDPPTTKIDNGDRIAGTTGSDWRGLYEFKTRFGGEIITYPAAFERQYWPLLATMARRYYQVGA